jgi:hypothetical protein
MKADFVTFAHFRGKSTQIPFRKHLACKTKCQSIKANRASNGRTTEFFG